MPRLPRCLLLAGWACLLVAVASQFAAAQPPAVTAVSPRALTPGQTIDVTLQGANLVGAASVWTSVPSQATLATGIDKNGTEAAKVVFRVTLPPEAPVGIAGLRVGAPGGISNLNFIIVDDLPTVAEGNTRTIPTAQEIPAACGVDGTADAENVDLYKVNLAAGQRVSIEAIARRMGSALDPAVRVLDANGKELAYNDDAPGLLGDSRFAFTAPAAGAYYIELRDVRFEGGGNHRYRLRVGNFPLASVAWPLGVQLGQSAQVNVVAIDGAAAAPLTYQAPNDPLVSLLTVGAKLPGGQGSALVTLATSQAPESVEAEPNNAPEQATVITLPCAVSGRFEQPRDRDFYQFAGKKGERWQFVGNTRRLGSPADLTLRVLKADGAVVGEAEDSGTAEGALSPTLPDDGMYRLQVEDLFGRGRSDLAYRVEITPYLAGFSLVSEVDTINVPLGGVLAVKVTAARRDYNGPITLAIEGIDGLTLTDNVIAEGKPDTVLKATLPASIPSGTIRGVRIVGSAKIGEVDVRSAADITAAIKKAVPTLAVMPVGLETAIGLGVGPVYPPQFEIALDPAAPVLPRLVGTNSFKVNAKRLNNFPEAITLAVEGLPANVTAKVPAIEKGKNDAVIELTGPEDLPLQTLKINIVATGVSNFQPLRVALADVALNVINPLQAAAAPAGALAQGGKQNVKVTVVRFGAEKPAIAVAFKNLPAGVTAPAGAMIAADQNEATFELTAAADTAVGKIENLVVSAATKIKNQDIAVESPPVALEVTAAAK